MACDRSARRKVGCHHRRSIKACAFSIVISHVSTVLGQHAHELLGKRVDEYIAEQLTLAGGGRPTPRSAVHEPVAKCQNGKLYPGKPRENPGGRPPSITEHQKNEVARVAMELKKRKINPSPALVRAKLPPPSTATPATQSRTEHPPDLQGQVLR